MARILITSGPTRQYIDPVRYLTNASSGRMGCALASGRGRLGHEVVIVSGPVHVAYPPRHAWWTWSAPRRCWTVCCDEFRSCDGLIAAAAPCDYRPQQVARKRSPRRASR